MKRIGDKPLTRSEINKRFYNGHKKEERARNKKYYSTYYPENRDRIKFRHRNRRHRITQEWFDAKKKEQNNCCAICQQVFVKTPHVDHDHRCCQSLRSCDKCRRDLLCDDCNLGLGRFKDNIEVLERAIEYLRRHNGLEHQPAVQTA
jgi:hypothetical protein